MQQDTDIGGSKSGGDAGDKPHRAFGEDSSGAGAEGSGAGGIDAKDAEQADTEQFEGTPDDVAFGTRRTAGRDEESGGG